MIELPEALNLARQIEQTMTGKSIQSVIAGHSPHKFAWYHDDPANYDDLLHGKTILAAKSHGGLVEVHADDVRMLFGDGISLRFVSADEKRPAKHQLLVEFTDGSALVASVQMYGGLWCFKEEEFTNPYYLIARSKPSPLSDRFDADYFSSMLDDKSRKLSAKAFLATEQRIPGLGNGVLQDILWRANVHPRRRIDSLTDTELEAMFTAVKSVLRQMSEQGGRDTEKDLFGQPGGYLTVLSKNTVHYPCQNCGTLIRKEAYLGGSIYCCPSCQQLV